MKNPFLLLWLVIGTCSEMYAQSFPVRTPYDDKSYQHAIVVYKNAMKEHLGLYNGSLYVGLNIPTKGFPFFKTDKFENGNVLFDDFYYQNVPLLYDILKDELIVPDHNKTNMLKLSGEKVSQFSLPGHIFFRLAKDTSAHSIPETGYYELLNNSKTLVFVKRKKSLQEINSGGVIINEIIEKNFYYIKKGNSYFPVKSKTSVLNVLKEHKKELSKYIKNVAVKFSTDRERAILLMVEEYDKLNEK